MNSLPNLKVAPDHCSLITSDGNYFFYLGDTAWELFHRLTYSDAIHYFGVRSRQGFNVVQSVALAEFDGIRTPNANGDLPFRESDITKPNEAYFAHIDALIDGAASFGLYTGFLPSWGDKLPGMHGVGPDILDEKGALFFGRWLGKRYRNKSIIWIIGGDRAVRHDSDLRVWRALAEGIRQEDTQSLMTFHPNGGWSSSHYVHAESWLNFNQSQSGHTGRDNPNWKLICSDLNLAPPKPSMDGEPNYENHPLMEMKGADWVQVKGQWFDDYDCRKAAYRALLAGACGHTYGCHDVWQFYDQSKFPSINGARTLWKEALLLPGAWQMRHLRSLAEKLRPKPSALASWINESDWLANLMPVSANAGINGKQITYLPRADVVLTAEILQIPEHGLVVEWYDPRSGQFSEKELVKHADQMKTPSSPFSDWIVIVSRDESLGGY